GRARPRARHRQDRRLARQCHRRLHLHPAGARGGAGGLPGGRDRPLGPGLARDLPGRPAGTGRPGRRRSPDPRRRSAGGGD
ncbi:MAG: hypothetical protein AVDCRST_MAG88-2777, partial [uncultured Thermomicrobiales bacterium]